MDFAALYTATQGRINRAKWWLGMILLAVVNIVLSWVLLRVLGAAAGIALFVLQLVLLYPAYAVGAKRFQDRDRPGILGLILPVVSLLSQISSVMGLSGRPEAPTTLAYPIHDRDRRDRDLVPDRPRHPEGHHRAQPLRTGSACRSVAPVRAMRPATPACAWR